MKTFFTLFTLLTLFTLETNASCIEFKVTPTVKLTSPQHKVFIEQKETQSHSAHGQVVAVMQSANTMSIKPGVMGDGFCVVLDALEIEYGYSHFIVSIDGEYMPNTAEYDIVMGHEQEHINAYLASVNNARAEFQSALETAAAGVMPIYIESRDEIDDARDKMLEQILQNPDVKLIEQKISADAELANKKVDARPDDLRIFKLKKGSQK